MQTLFPTPSFLPPGFCYQPDFITSAEEQTLLAASGRIDLQELIFQGHKAKRRVKSYGYDYNFDTRKITAGEPVPEQFLFLTERIADKLAVPVRDIAEMLVTEYPEGSVINWHRDAPPFGIIAGVSLLSECRFRFRPYDKTKQSRSSIVSLTVLPRSLYIIKDEARSMWEHSIMPVKAQRFSITFRTLKQNGTAH